MARPMRAESGTSSVEYGLMAFAIAAVIALTVFGLGGVTTDMYADSCDEMRTGAATSGIVTTDCT